jgi:threonine dehydrogenase-like Zn-dependent dehydrogenase
MSSRIARHRGYRVIGVDLVPERIEMAQRYGIEVLNLQESDVAREIRQRTDGRGPSSVIDAVGMEAHGGTAAELTQKLTSFLPDRAAQALMKRTGVDRLTALTQSIETVCRGGTHSITGVYGGTADPLNMLHLFDKGITLAMGQAHVKRWVDDLMPLLMGDGDPLGVGDFATHLLPLEEAPHGYEIFQRKEDGAIKIVLQP